MQIRFDFTIWISSYWTFSHVFDQILAPVSLYESSFHNYFHWVSSKSCLCEITRLFSSNSSSNSEQYENLQALDPLKMIKTLLILRLFFLSSMKGPLIFYGIKDNFAAENDFDFVNSKIYNRRWWKSGESKWSIFW